MIYPAIILASLFLSYPVLADGFDRSDTPPVESADPEPVPPGSDASFDKRLPPVLPGEHVNDSGRTMRVWSTAGPVPVSRAPEAPEPWNNGTGGDTKIDEVDVIVDQRKGLLPPTYPKENTLDEKGLKLKSK